MPILLPVQELRPGMKPARSVMNGTTRLLPAGRAMTTRDVRRLRDLLHGATVAISDPLIDELADFEDTSQDERVAQHVRNKVAGVLSHLDSSVQASAQVTGELIDQLGRLVEDIIRFLRENPAGAVMLDQMDDCGGYLQEHNASVFYISMMIAAKLSCYIRQERERLTRVRTTPGAFNLVPLGLGALFHDIGMVPVQHLFEKKEPLTPEEAEVVKRHPIAGAEMLPSSVGGMAKQIVRQHHEAFDGSGYPEGLSGEQVNIFARIVRVADAFSTATMLGKNGKGRPAYQVLFDMTRGPNQQKFDPIVLKMFATLIHPFAIGAKLQLSDGSFAVVVQRDQEEPFLPVVIQAFHEDGTPFEQKELRPPFRLRERDDLRPMKFGQHDLRKIIELVEILPGLNEPRTVFPHAREATSVWDQPRIELTNCLYP
jgi:HD-GYP domain-containing protein (c-di-GMP phosphodiesterase class II)